MQHLDVNDTAAPDAVREILSAFVRRTGLEPAAAVPRRYLWTDAFAVGTLLELHRTAGDREPLEWAVRLVDQVHETLGRHRPDDSRSGWISGLDDDQGRLHPTSGGLRIGKRLPERGPQEPFDERLEWERDGQYFHYLTKWMHALARLARAVEEERYLRWAIELARAAHAGFSYSPPGATGKRLVWKASIDLTRPLVPSMGAHDPLDGLLTFRALRDDALRLGWSAADVGLDRAIGELRSMCAGRGWATADPLGVGGLLGDAYRLALLSRTDDRDAALLPALVDGAAAGLAALASGGSLCGPAEARLAFRELGLAIGLHAVPRLAGLVERESPQAAHLRELRRPLEVLLPFVPLAANLEAFWSDPEHQRVESWQGHLDINDVTLATSRMPGGLLGT